jgi:hypothetical protein
MEAADTEVVEYPAALEESTTTVYDTPLVSPVMLAYREAIPAKYEYEPIIPPPLVNW